jgi:putative SOS response-associated peptidase YedK
MRRRYDCAMCANYRAVTSEDRMLTFFGVEREPGELPVDAWPGYLAPFIRLAEPGSGNKVAEIGQFGLLPAFGAEMAKGKRLHNARSETVARLQSFRDSWKEGRRCIIPAEWIYEPNWETGEPVRWRIEQAGAIPIGVAGIYKWDRDLKDGVEKWFFSMLTINADDHPVFSRFHAPGEEKRSVVILRPEDYEDWLSCSVADAPHYFKPWSGPLECSADPLPPRVKKPKPPPPVPRVEDPGLF